MKIFLKRQFYKPNENETKIGNENWKQKRTKNKKLQWKTKTIVHKILKNFLKRQFYKPNENETKIGNKNEQKTKNYDEKQKQLFMKCGKNSVKENFTNQMKTIAN